MNRIYKTIWNAATQSWTVAGELASAKGKSASKTVTTLAALSVASVLGVSSAMAADNALPKLTSVDETPDTNIVTKYKDGGKTVIIINNDNKNSVTTGTNSKDGIPKHIIVVGSQNKQVYDGQILIGYEINSPAEVYGKNGKSAGKAGDVAIGHHITLGGSDGTTAGDTAKNVQDSFSTAVGYGSQAVGPVVAMGVGARSDMRAYQGWDSVKEGIVAVGPFALAADNKNGTTAIGALSAANYDNSVAIGALSGAAADWEDRGIGEQFNPGIDQAGKDKAKYQILESYGPSNVRQGLTSVGYKAGARGGASTALGFEAVTGAANMTVGQNSTAVGVRAHAVKDNSLAIGDNALAGGLTKAEADQLQKKNDGEIARLRALRDRAQGVLDEAQLRLKGDGSAENKFKVASATATLERIKLAIERAEKDATRLSNKDSNTQFSIAIGSSAHANNYQTTAIGRFAKAYGAGSNAVGYEARAEGDYSNAMGYEAKAYGDRSNAIGYKTIVGKTHGKTRTDSTAIGSNNTVDAKEVMVLGNNVEIDSKDKIRDGAVVLGDKSTGKEHTVKAVNSAKVGEITYEGFAGNLGDKGTDGNTTEPKDKQGRFVSIGSKGNERQIKHVAAGWIDKDSTDAINGSQLYVITKAQDIRIKGNEENITKLGDRVTNVEGDVTKLGDRVTNVEGDVTKLGDQVTNVEGDVTKLGDRVTNVEGNVTKLGDRVTNVEGDVTKLGDRITTNEGNITKLGDRIDHINTQISNSGFSIKQNDKSTIPDKETEIEKVTAKDTINFVNGNGTTVKAITKKGMDETAADETSISVNVDAIKYTNKDGKDVIQEDGKYFVVDKDGNKTSIDEKDVVMNITNPKGGETIINNLKDGKVSENSKEAVNGKQLHSVDKKVNENTKSINNLTGQVNENKQNISNLGDRINNINSTINNVVGDQVKNINNRVDGVENRVNHLDNKINNVDKRVNHLDNKISNVDKRASRGIATAGAMGMLPQPHISGRSMMAAATTSYRGQQALAVGYSRLSDNGKHIIKFSGASNLSGKKDAMVGAAYGYQW